MVTSRCAGRLGRECLDFARAFAQALVRRQPELFTERITKAGREDKILVNYLQQPHEYVDRGVLDAREAGMRRFPSR